MSGYVAGVLEIDTLLGGWERVTAGFLIEGPAPALVETGSQSSVPSSSVPWPSTELTPNDLASIAVTHITSTTLVVSGTSLRVFPKADVYVHPKGARHLVDPTRLVASGRDRRTGTPSIPYTAGGADRS